MHLDDLGVEAARERARRRADEALEDVHADAHVGRDDRRHAAAELVRARAFGGAEARGADDDRGALGGGGLEVRERRRGRGEVEGHAPRRRRVAGLDRDAERPMPGASPASRPIAGWPSASTAATRRAFGVAAISRMSSCPMRPAAPQTTSEVTGSPSRAGGQARATAAAAPDRWRGDAPNATTAASLRQSRSDAPRSRRACASASCLAGSRSGVSGRRSSSRQMPSRATAYLSGIGLVSEKHARMSGSSRS